MSVSTPSEPDAKGHRPWSDALAILYRDDHLVAVNKPAGLLVHRSAIDRHETRFALRQVREQIGRQVYPVHRLDKPVSGVLLFALSADAARRMLLGFLAGVVDKTYLAVVRGHASESGVIDYPLQEQLDRLTDAKTIQNKLAQSAVTAYRRLAAIELSCAVGRYSTARYSLLRVMPQTGRKHQIRRHLKHIFHPIVGDTTYGDGRHNRFFREHFGCQRLLLAATHLVFPHPYTGARVDIQAPLDESFSRLVAALGWGAEACNTGSD
jgi:tRNA pseudouridine65 synthase